MKKLYGQLQKEPAREDAILYKKTRYLSDYPCRKCGNNLRSTSSKNCVTCNLIASKNSRERDRSKLVKKEYRIKQKVKLKLPFLKRFKLAIKILFDY